MVLTPIVNSSDSMTEAKHIYLTYTAKSSNTYKHVSRTKTIQGVVGLCPFVWAIIHHVKQSFFLLKKMTILLLSRDIL